METEVLPLGVTVTPPNGYHHHQKKKDSLIRTAWPTAFSWDIAEMCRSLELTPPECAVATRAISRVVRERQSQGQQTSLPGR